MIAITFALPAESSDFLRLLEHRGAVSREGVETTRGRLHGKSIAVIHTGVGKKASREAMEIMLRRERFEYLISTGFAGALEKNLRVGHLLVAENFTSPQVLSLPQLALADDGAFVGTLLTVTQMIETSADRESLHEKTGAAAVDMETEILAEICGAHDLPMLSLRAISDTASDPFPAPAQVLFDVTRQKTNFVRLGSYLLTHPAAFVRLNAFRERIAVARRTLADALEQILRADLL
jgi:adenosylhomocysteine nucleosidase